MATSPTRSEQPAIPLVADVDVDPDASMGTLVADATKHLSTLVRAEVELAKLEITASVKSGVRGAVWFIVALVIMLFSLFFFWLMVGEILNIWLPRWAAFTIVFVLMLLAAGLAGYRGYKKVKKVGKPEQTIASLQDTGKALTNAVKTDQIS